MRVMTTFVKTETVHNRVVNHYDTRLPQQSDQCNKVKPVCRPTESSCENVGTKSDKSLAGPASCKKSRKVNYPCDKGGCFIECPCIICQALDFDVTVEELFNDHTLYHNAWHTNCKFCSNLFKCVPCFSYTSYVIKYNLLRNFEVESVQVPWKLYTYKHDAVTVRRVSKGEKMHCEDCGLVFTQAVSKYRHVREVHGSKEFSCDECVKKFRRKENLERHMLSHHKDPTQMECKDCGGKFTNYAHWKRHINANYDEDGKPRDVCPECGDEFCSPKRLKKHISKEHSRFECDYCGYAFSKQNNLLEHSLLVTKTCEVCELVICGGKQMKDHMKKEHQVKPQCNKCKKIFLQKWLLERHLREASEITCELCEIICCNKKDIQKHKSSVHGANQNAPNEVETPGKFQCNKCGQRFMRKSFLERHETTKFACNACEIVCCNLRRLRRHQYNVHEEKQKKSGNEDDKKENHQCQRCGYVFQKKWLLERHEKDALEYTCDKCSKKFCHSRGMERHQAIVH